MKSEAVRNRVTRVVGILAPSLFVASFLLQGMRRGYDPRLQFVSELSIGQFGWLQMTTFFVAGAGFLVFGFLLARRRGESRMGPTFFIVLGISLAASGVFTTDPSAMFDQTSTAGVIHGLLGAVVFTLFPVICFVYCRELRKVGQLRAAVLTFVTGILLVVGIAVLKASELSTGPLFEVKGLIQRVILVLFMAWSAAFAVIRTGQDANLSS